MKTPPGPYIIQPDKGVFREKKGGKEKRLLNYMGEEESNHSD